MGRIKLKPHSVALFKRERELRTLAGQVESPEKLALWLSTIKSMPMRQAVLNRIKPWLKFKLNADQNAAI